MTFIYLTNKQNLKDHCVTDVLSEALIQQEKWVLIVESDTEDCRCG